MSITNYLMAPKGANPDRKRRGRGQGSGHGGTSCRGHKGQQARGNTMRARGLEGGQMPLARRLPKRGFTNKFRREYRIVSLKILSTFSDSAPITLEVMQKKGLIRKSDLLVKVLDAEKLTKKLEIHAHAFTKSAKESIETAGGKAVVIKKVAKTEAKPKSKPKLKAKPKLKPEAKPEAKPKSKPEAKPETKKQDKE